MLKDLCMNINVSTYMLDMIVFRAFHLCCVRTSRVGILRFTCSVIVLCCFEEVAFVYCSYWLVATCIDAKLI